MPASPLDQLASIAHELWLDRMQNEGWKPGRVYDASAQTHDALKPFQDLDPRDQAFARDAVQASGVLEQLSRILDYPRGSNTASSLSEFAVGLRVRLVQTDRIEGVEIKPDDTGIVCQTEPAEGDPITRVVVQWPSGDKTVHRVGDDDLRTASDT